MSDAVEKTAAGATRGLLGSYSFILVMLGLEMWTSERATQFGLGLFLLIVGGLLAYAAFFWETAKKVLSIEAQMAIGNFAQSRATWAFVIFLVLQAFIFAPFIEQHRWPFSYPVDAETISRLNKVSADLNTSNAKYTLEKELADKWRFATILRRGISNCGYQMQFTQRAASSANFWEELFRYGGWNQKSGGIALAPAPGSASSGITIRIGNSDIGARCAEALQKGLTDVYPNPPSKAVNNQQSALLNICPDCVQVEFDY